MREHDPNFFRHWAAEKVEILMRMLEAEGSSHALPDTERDRLHADLLEFIDS